MAKKRDKKTDKKSTSLKEEKKVVTIKVPSVDLKKIDLKYVAILLGGLLLISLFFNFKGGFGGAPNGKLSLSGLVYMCPPSSCDTTNIEEWSDVLGIGVTPYEADWATGAIGLLFEDNTVKILDVSSKTGFYKTVCDYTQKQEACDIAQEEEQKQTEQSCETLKKETKPKLEAFVVSYCPYGLQMQRVLVPVHELLGSTADITIRYMGEIVDGKITAMHGDQEAQENLKQICLREEQPSKYWEYISCFMKANGKSEACSTEVGVDKSKLEECMTDPEKGLKYAQVDFTQQNKYGVTGSPTLIINGEDADEFLFGGRTSEALKTLICCGMSKQTTQCQTKLSTEQANTAFAEQYSSGSTTGTGSC